ncbi:MAG: putative sulfate exporter family transporter [Fusobacteriales bacterium]|nr:MAG: putative sulfate exporter family transporter [Fusobacteriales bacterium]
MQIIYGVLLCVFISLPATYFGKIFPIIGAPVIAIFIGMILMPFAKKYKFLDSSLKFTSKKILQMAVVLLGFSLSLSVILKSGMESLPIIISTISIALISAFYLQRLFKIDVNTATLIGVGSSICGGSAIAATAPVIEATDDEVAKSISVIFLFNVLAALIFPTLGKTIGMSDFGFGVFAGTAINDTSSVTAAASIWDSLYNTNTLEIATVIKLTRTLAIIPIVLCISIYREKKLTKNNDEKNKKISVVKLVPKFLILFLLASLVATLINLPKEFVHNTKFLSKFFITMAMASIGLKTNIVNLIRTGGKAILLGFICWTLIIFTSLGMQFVLNFI